MRTIVGPARGEAIITADPARRRQILVTYYSIAGVTIQQVYLL